MTQVRNLLTDDYGWPMLSLHDVRTQTHRSFGAVIFPKAGRATLGAALMPPRGLQAVATKDGRYTVLAIDHGSSLRAFLDPDGGAVSDERLRAIKRAVVDALVEYCSAVLLDLDFARYVNPKWPLGPQTGLVVGLDGIDYDGNVHPLPRLPTKEDLDWAVAAGADAAKIVFYYEPDQVDARQRYDLLCEVVVRCRSRGLPMLVEPLPMASPGDGARDWPVAEVARLAADAGAELVKLPLTPGMAAKQSAAITKALGPIPWVVLSSGLHYQEFLENLRVALEGGAAGFAAGRSIWEELVQTPESRGAIVAARGRLAQAVALTREVRSRGRGRE